MLLAMLLDAAVICGLVYLLNEGDSPGFGTAFGTAIALAVGFFACAYFLGGYLGLLTLVPMALVAAAVFWLACDLPVRRAAIAGGVLLGYKIAFAVFLAVLL